MYTDLCTDIHVYRRACRHVRRHSDRVILQSCAQDMCTRMWGRAVLLFRSYLRSLLAYDSSMLRDGFLEYVGYLNILNRHFLAIYMDSWTF